MEPALIKAVKKGEKDVAMTMVSSRYMSYELLCTTDGNDRNVLHHAVDAQIPDLVRRLIFVDSDQGRLRAQKDNKNKLPI